ncbi:hypothetical protein [Fictibacillus phosphorivorans]|uniref:hypothetical protein n=1 Tax=Fictibacillus phosphorivorans TaxID=1221500 RepID=UPI00203F3016|nr:hypothetical protein [Fictibacillus phosphorivorans]MCM3719036.1 hypothetical protein [Fictibacillus phosphorivorans]MCM3776658.1 hypothetical protein [Fictibacillus phosphorivorans]
MKKFLALTAAAILALSVGCGKEEKPKEEGKPAAATEKKEDDNTQKITLLNFEGELIGQLREYHAPFNAYAAGAAKEGEEAPPKEELDKLKADAKAAGEKAVSEIPSVEVPSDLSEDHQTKIKAALEELKKSYEAKVAGLEDEAKATEANKLFTAFEEKLNTIHEDLKLIPGKFINELQ